MKLYYFPVAPNPTKVITFVREKGIELDLVEVSLRDGEQRSDAHLARNPRGSLPVLELDDGSCITESLTIMEYLEELYPEPCLIGATPRQRAHIRQIERQADLGVLTHVARYIHNSNSPLGLPSRPAVADAAMGMLENSLPHVDAVIADHPFVAGERISIADCTLFAALQFAEFFDLKAHHTHGNIMRWLQDFRQRPSTQL